MTLRVGIISAAWGAQAHLPAWRAVPGVDVVGICTAHRETAEAAAATHQVSMPFWDAQEMARHPEIDVVDVGTRPSYRRDMCLGALAAGKHVYTGIPFAADLDAARALRDAASSAGTVAVVDAYSEHFGVFRFAEEVLAEGTLGALQSVVGRLELSLFAQPTSTFPYNWFHDASFGASAAQQPRVPPAAPHGAPASGRSPRRPGRRRSTSTGGTSSTAPAGSTSRSPTPRWRRCASSPGPSGCSPRPGRARRHPASTSRSPATGAGSCCRRR